MSKDKNAVARDLRLMPCYAGGGSYYLNAARIRSVHRKEEWRLNWRSDAPLGWIKRAGEEIPIHDLARAIGVSHRDVAGNAVVVDTPAGPRAWGVGAIGRVIEVPNDKLMPLPDACRGGAEAAPWLGVLNPDGEEPALCLAPERIGHPDAPQVATPPPVRSTGPRQDPSGRAILFAAFDNKGRLPEVRFCVGYGQVAEFVVKPSLIPLPSAQAWLPALLVWRGRSVPVLNLAWGVNGRTAPAPETEDYLVVRTEGDESLVAVPVVGWPDSVDLPVEATPDPAPPVARANWFLAAFRRKHQLIFTPDFAAILRTQS